METFLKFRDEANGTTFSPFKALCEKNPKLWKRKKGEILYIVENNELFKLGAVLSPRLNVALI